MSHLSQRRCLLKQLEFNFIIWYFVLTQDKWQSVKCFGNLYVCNVNGCVLKASKLSM